MLLEFLLIDVSFLVTKEKARMQSYLHEVFKCLPLIICLRERYVEVGEVTSPQARNPSLVPTDKLLPLKNRLYIARVVLEMVLGLC